MQLKVGLCWHPYPIDTYSNCVMFTLPAPWCTQFGWLVAIVIQLCLQLPTFTLWCPRQDVVTVAVVLDMDACVGRDQHLCCFPTEALAGMCFDCFFIHNQLSVRTKRSLIRFVQTLELFLTGRKNNAAKIKKRNTICFWLI